MSKKINIQPTPKRFTATNDITGALIKSRTSGQDAYSANYDAIFRKPQPETTEQLVDITEENVKNTLQN